MTTPQAQHNCLFTSWNPPQVFRSVHYTCRYFFSLKLGSHHTDEVITNNNNLPLAVEDMSWITILIELCYKYGKQPHVADGDIFLAPGFIPHLCTVHVKMVTKFKPLDLHFVFMSYLCCSPCEDGDKFEAFEFVLWYEVLYRSDGVPIA